MAIGIYIPHIDNRSVDNSCPAQSIGERLTGEGLVNDPSQVIVQLRTKKNRAGYNSYSAFVQVRDDGWGHPENVTHILRLVHSDGYRMYTNRPRSGFYWLLLPNRRDTEEHEALAREQVAFELDVATNMIPLVSAVNRISNWYQSILTRRRCAAKVIGETKLMTVNAVEPDITKGSIRGNC